MKGWFGTLRGRITLVTVSVAVVAVVVTGVISLQLVRSSALDEARSELGAQAELLARLPAAARVTTLTERVTDALGDIVPALVDAEGQVTGPGARYLTAGMIDQLVAGEDLSAVIRRGGERVIVEGRATDQGTAIVLARPQENIIRTAEGRILLALGIGLIVALIGGTWLARWLTRPLVETAATARRMASGERGLTIERGQPAEIAAVAAALAALDHALATSEGRQREFLMSISHDLRTPLTAVRGYGEALADGLVGADEVAGVGRTLVAETERLDRFVADLLELARLEADDFAITPRPFDANGILDETRDAWLGRSATLGVELVRMPAATPLPLTTDARRVRQLLDGLVENALRVSPAGSTVALIGRRNGDTVVLEVRDGGPGLSAEDLEVAFDRGALRERYRNERPVGTGLGLSIAARLASRLGGSIRAGNADGGGASFTVTFTAG